MIDDVIRAPKIIDGPAPGGEGWPIIASRELIDDVVLLAELEGPAPAAAHRRGGPADVEYGPELPSLAEEGEWLAATLDLTPVQRSILGELIDAAR